MLLKEGFSTQVENQREIAVKDLSLDEARRQSDTENESVTKIKETIRQTQMKTMKLAQEKMEVEKQLQLKEQELESLCTGHQEDSEQLCNKEREIRELRKRLHKIEGQLSIEKKISEELREKLQQATVELEKKSAVEQVQAKASGDLKTHLEREKKMVDFLQIQLTSASTFKNQYTREIEVK